MRLTRRGLLQGTAAFGALHLLPRCKSYRDKFEMPLPIPPVLAPVRSDATTDYYTMTMRAGRQQVVPYGPKTALEGFEGMWPGPTISTRRGRKTVVTQVNGLDHRVTTHLHGANTPAIYDGHPVDYIEPGKSKEYHYGNDQIATTLWYHDHTWNETSRNLWRGLAGLYIIGDDFWDSLNLPSGEFDIPLVLADRVFDGDNQMPFPGDHPTRVAVRAPSEGNIGCVNGVVTPHLEVARRKYLFRILNATALRTLGLTLLPADQTTGVVDSPSFDTGDDARLRKPMIVVGSDGGLLPEPVPVLVLEIVSGERYNVVIDFSQYPEGTSLILRNAFFPADGLVDFMRFDVVRSAKDDSVVPSKLLPFTPYNPADAVATKTIIFGDDADVTGEQTHFQMNGRVFDPARIDFESKLGDLEIWEVRSGPRYPPHSLHVHLAQVQILDVGGALPLPEKRGWKDIVYFNEVVQSARFMVRPTNFTGTFAMHCHFLDHEDMGMMAQWRVTG